MSDAETIRALHQEGADALNAGDAKAITALFAEDAVYMPQGAAALHGKEAIQGFYEQIVDDFSGVSVSTDEVVVAGDWAFERGTSAGTIATDEDPSEFTGKFLSIWQHQADGSWKVARAIWNLDN